MMFMCFDRFIKKYMRAGGEQRFEQHDQTGLVSMLLKIAVSSNSSES